MRWEKLNSGRIKLKTMPADSNANARFVEVTVNARTAHYALTPIVGAFNSGAIDATAYAGLGSAVCKVPPVMICNPQETGGSTTFNPGALLGVGLKLVTVGAGGGWAPGNFGYLDTGGGSNGANGLREALGWVSPPGDCIEQTGVDTKPGATVDVVDSLNTRSIFTITPPAKPGAHALRRSIRSRTWFATAMPMAEIPADCTIADGKKWIAPTSICRRRQLRRWRRRLRRVQWATRAICAISFLRAPLANAQRP